jgi:tetratricopeptide (TPR) repeat protein
MLRNTIALLIVFSFGRFALAETVDDAREMLARAEALYYEADFEKSVELLLRAAELLRDQPGYQKEKSAIKLQIALGLIGLNDSARAKQYLGELYALDADHKIDPQMFSPKVIQLAEEARAEQNERRCRSISDEAQQQLDRGNSDAVMKIIESGQMKCGNLTQLSPRAADLLFKDGLAAYKRSDMQQALLKFRGAQRLDAKNELAAEYTNLTLSKLEVAADRAILQWQKNFTSGDFPSAARDYRELTSRGSPETLDYVRGEYRKALSPLVDQWNRACAKSDAAAAARIKEQIQTLLPETSFAEDILALMKTCTPAGCIQMETGLALARLKTRVDPQFPAATLSQYRSPVTIRVKLTIDDKGDAAVGEQSGGGPLLTNPIRVALEQWRFLPAVVQGEARCIETEIPLVINWN